MLFLSPYKGNPYEEYKCAYPASADHRIPPSHEPEILKDRMCAPAQDFDVGVRVGVEVICLDTFLTDRVVAIRG